MGQLLAVRKGEHVMSTMTGTMRRTILSSVVGALIALGAVGAARAEVASDKPGAILVLPKIVIDTSGRLGPKTDTIVQVTNTSNSVIAARCFLVDATSQCSNRSATDPLNFCTAELAAQNKPFGQGGCPVGGACVPRWLERDFQMKLTKRQPVSWKVSDGLPTFPCDAIGGPAPCPPGQTNTGSNGSPSSVPPAGDVFFGEIKCIEVDPADFKPTIGFDPTNNAAGDLKGEATIVSVDAAGAVDARKYNGIGIQSTTINNRDDVLFLGGDPAVAEYNGCPNVLIMNHLFDDATVVTHGTTAPTSARVRTDLTVVPCSEDFNVQENNLGGAVLQFLVYNEFEQRFSTSTNFTCFREVPLSDIDTRPGPNGDPQSIFNVGVQGTLAGQTRIRPVAGQTLANAVLGIIEEFWTCTSGPNGRCSSATNLHFTGTPDKRDEVVLSTGLP